MPRRAAECANSTLRTDEAAPRLPTAPRRGELCGQRGLQARLLGDQPDVGAAAAADPDLVPVGGALEVVAEMVAELVRADVKRLGR